MSQDILLFVKSISAKRGVSEEEVFESIEAALAVVAEKRYPEGAKLRVAIDRKTGDYETFRCWEVVDVETSAEVDEGHAEEMSEEEPGLEEGLEEAQIKLPQAKEIDPELEIGDIVENQVDSVDFGRIAAQQVKQFIMLKLREAERSKIVRSYENRIGELLIGVVKRVTRDSVILDMGDNAEALLRREEMIPREAFRVNDRARAYLYDVRKEKRGPQLLVSRTHPQMLVELFKIEVPEIGEEVIEIKAVARDPGSRAKIAVKTNDGRIDPIGACVGMRGSRVQAVSNELGGERIDIVLWDDNPAQLVINAMAPAEVSSVVVDEDTKAMDIAVEESQLSQAIGRGGQNIRLASELSDWILNIMTEEQATQKQEGEALDVKKTFMEKLEIGEDVAEVLIAEGFTTLEELAYVPIEELQKIEEFDEDITQELQRRASDVLLTQEIASEEERGGVAPAEDLLEVEGMTQQLALQLASKSVITRDDLAEYSVDELKEIIEIDSGLAAELIMAARQHWFNDVEVSDK